MVYRTWRQWRQKGGGNVKTTKMAAEQTWLVSDGRVAASRQQDSSDRNSSGSNMDYCRGCSKTVATAVTTRWRSKFGLAVASVTAMAAARQKQQFRKNLAFRTWRKWRQRGSSNSKTRTTAAEKTLFGSYGRAAVRR